MNKNPFQHKTALILGADTPTGRAVALQLSRAGANLIIAGDHAKKLNELENDILRKLGDPLSVLLSPNNEQSLKALADKRAIHGHLHFVINTIATLEGASDDPGASGRRALELNGVVEQLVSGRGAARFATVWNDQIGAHPELVVESWHTMVRVNDIEGQGGVSSEKEGVRPGAIAEGVLRLLSCPAGACPVEVQFASRELKAF
jgi:NAD(P)-dependent dehydrogenase (short-subunit alcohol dehydrogenase family)